MNNSHLYHQAKADFKNRGIEGRCQIKMLFIMCWFNLWQCTTNILFVHAGYQPQKKDLLLLFNVLSQVIFAFLLFLGMVMHAYEVETKEK